MITILTEPQEGASGKLLLAVAFPEPQANAFRRIGALRATEPQAVESYPILHLTVQVKDTAHLVLWDGGGIPPIFLHNELPKAAPDFYVEDLKAHVTAHGFRFTYVLKHLTTREEETTQWISWADYDSARNGFAS